ELDDAGLCEGDVRGYARSRTTGAHRGRSQRCHLAQHRTTRPSAAEYAAQSCIGLPRREKSAASIPSLEGIASSAWPGHTRFHTSLKEVSEPCREWVVPFSPITPPSSRRFTLRSYISWSSFSSSGRSW